MGQAELKQQKLSIQEWLDLEQENGERYEYHFGEVFAMAGGTRNHSLISGNAFYEVDNNFRVKEMPCQTHSSELKIEITHKGRYVYPDMLAVCDEVADSDEVTGAVTNPILVIEVLSESSEAYDHGEKFRYYRKLPSVREYLILNQDKPAATLYRRNGTGDLFTRHEIEGMDTFLTLDSVDLNLLLGRLYRNVEFPKAEANA